MKDTWTDPVVEQEVAALAERETTERGEFEGFCVLTAGRPIGDAWADDLWRASEVFASRLDGSERFWRGWIIGRLASGLAPIQVIQEGMAKIEARESLVRPR